MNKNRMNLRLFDNDVNIIDRTGAESLIPIQESNEIIQGVIAQSAVLSRGRKLANMTSKQYKMPVLDMLPIAYFVNGDSGQKKTTKQAWDKKFIIAEEIAVIVPIPEAVLDDSQYDIWGEVKPRVTEAFGNKIDGAVLFGTDKPSTWRDDVVATATKVGSVVTLGSADPLYDKIMEEDGVIAKVENCGYMVNGHMADISMRAKLRGLKNANGDPLFKTDMQVPDSICRSYWVRCYWCSHDYNPFIFFYVRLGIPCISVNHKIDTFHALTSIRQLHFIISSNLHTGYISVMTHHSASNLKQIVGSQLRF